MPVDGGAERAVGGDEPALVGRQSDGVEVEQVGVRRAPDREQQV